MRTKKTILVTGGTGFVGSYLLRYLADLGYTHIRALRRPSSRTDLLGPLAGQIDWIEGDILDYDILEEALAGADEVYHCAALISFDSRDVKRMFEVNVTGTANVVNAALHTGIEKLVHVSSVAALGRTRNGETLNEQSLWQRGRFNTNYAISKFLAEQEVWRGIAEGLPAAIVNPTIILGGGRWEEGPLRFFRLAWDNFPFYSSGASGFVDVRDVARFMIRLMESDITGERYVLNAQNTPYGDLLRRIAAHLGRRPPNIRVGRLLRQITWRLSWLSSRLTGRRAFITRETARNAGHTFYFDPAKSMLDFDFQYIPLEETLAATCRLFEEASRVGFAPKILPLAAF